MSKFLCWRSTSRVDFESAVVSHKAFTVEEVAVILTIVRVYMNCFDWAAFELLRIGDDKYTIIFQRVRECDTIKISVK